jgi:hypothetical protein
MKREVKNLRAGTRKLLCYLLNVAKSEKFRAVLERDRDWRRIQSARSAALQEADRHDLSCPCDEKEKRSLE